MLFIQATHEIRQEYLHVRGQPGQNIGGGAGERHIMDPGMFEDLHFSAMDFSTNFHYLKVF